MARLCNSTHGYYDEDDKLTYQFMFGIDPKKCSLDYIFNHEEVQFDLRDNDYFAGSVSGRKPTDPRNRPIEEHDRVEIWTKPTRTTPARVIAQGWVKEIQVDAPFDDNARPYCPNPKEDTKYRALVCISGWQEKICTNETGAPGSYYQGRPVSKHQGYVYTGQKKD